LTKTGVHVGIALGNNQENFQIQRLTMSEWKFGKSFKEATFWTHTVYYTSIYCYLLHSACSATVNAELYKQDAIISNQIKFIKSNFFAINISCGAKKLHRFIFAIALSELHLLRQFLANIYFNNFSIIHLFHILYIITGGEPAHLAHTAIVQLCHETPDFD